MNTLDDFERLVQHMHRVQPHGRAADARGEWGTEWRLIQPPEHRICRCGAPWSASCHCGVQGVQE